MKWKNINVVWCDDNVERWSDVNKLGLFDKYGCTLFKTARSSDELKTILHDYQKYIDAVIVDFNLGQEEIVPEEYSAKGFRWIHDHLDDYPSIPFYLFSGRDIDFIKSKYHDFEYKMEDDYFFKPNEYVSSKRNRYFYTDSFDDLLMILVEEVSNRSTPEFKIRQEYVEAFAAIYKFELDGDVFLKVLGDEVIDRYDLPDIVNRLRKVIENFISKLENDYVIPEDYDLNKIPYLLSGKRRKEDIRSEDCDAYKSEDFMNESLFKAFELYIQYTQDGSHDKTNSFFSKYLKDTGDTYIVRALAIIGLDVVRWMCEFYEKYVEFQLFKFVPFIGVVKCIKSQPQYGAIVISDNDKSYFIQQPEHPNEKFTVGTKLKILSRKSTNKKHGDYFVYSYQVERIE